MQKIKKINTLIISDLHLGSLVSQPRKALELLKSYSFEKLILLGDVFDSLDFRDLDENCWDLLNYIGKISQTKKVRWVEGNHDTGLSQMFKALLGAKVYQEYHWNYKKEKYLAIHGHQFDRFLINNTFLSYLATKFYDFIQKIDFDDKRISYYIKTRSKGWLRLSEKVARGAMAFGKKKGAKYVFCGHTHKKLFKENHTIKYYNSGCWADTPCAYITIDENKIELREI